MADFDKLEEAKTYVNVAQDNYNTIVRQERKGFASNLDVDDAFNILQEAKRDLKRMIKHEGRDNDTIGFEDFLKELPRTENKAGIVNMDRICRASKKEESTK